MTKIINEIRKIIGNHWSSELGIKFYGDSIVFHIYEVEIPIICDEERVYIDTETMNSALTTDMLNELAKICTVLQENKDVLKQFYYETEGRNNKII